MMEYTFDRFRLRFLTAEQKQDVRALRELVMVAADSWKKDYRLLAAVWLFLIQHWLYAAEHGQFELANSYGPMLEMICNVTARQNLHWDDYQAFGRLTEDPFNTPYQAALKDRKQMMKLQ